jgi:hypothetical protein
VSHMSCFWSAYTYSLLSFIPIDILRWIEIPKSVPRSHSYPHMLPAGSSCVNYHCGVFDIIPKFCLETDAMRLLSCNKAALLSPVQNRGRRDNSSSRSHNAPNTMHSPAHIGGTVRQPQHRCATCSNASIRLHLGSAPTAPHCPRTARSSRKPCRLHFSWREKMLGTLEASSGGKLTDTDRTGIL